MVFNDPHIADRPPLGRKDDYRTTILSKIWTIKEIVKQEEITQVVCTGDLFHYKNPKHTSVETMFIVRHLLAEFGVPVWVLPGNHDIPGGLDDLNKQPISLIGSGDVHVITSSGAAGNDNVQLVFRPYDRKRDCDPTYYELDEQELERAKKLPTLMFAHGSIIAPGQDRPYPHITIDQINLRGIHAFCSGHIHEDLGIHEIIQEAPHTGGLLSRGNWACQFMNVGALARTSRTEANLTRKIQVGIVELRGDPQLEIRCRTVILDVAPGPDVFHDQVVVKGQEVPDSIIEFAESVSEGLQAETVDLDTLLEQMPEFPDIEAGELRDIIKHYLEEAQI